MEVPNSLPLSFEKSAVLNKLTNLQRERIVLNAKISNVRERQILFSTGQTCDQIVVVLEGQGVTSKGEEFAKGNRW
jgi:CRP-like cAMP-binding protein